MERGRGSEKSTVKNENDPPTDATQVARFVRERRHACAWESGGGGIGSSNNNNNNDDAAAARHEVATLTGGMPAAACV